MKHQDHLKSGTGSQCMDISSPLYTSCRCDKEPSTPSSELPRRTIIRTETGTEPQAEPRTQASLCAAISLIANTFHTVVELNSNPTVHPTFAPIASSCLPGYPKRNWNLGDLHMEPASGMPHRTMPSGSKRRQLWLNRGPHSIVITGHAWNYLIDIRILTPPFSRWSDLGNITEAF